jgi:hypothetical protein
VALPHELALEEKGTARWIPAVRMQRGVRRRSIGAYLDRSPAAKLVHVSLAFLGARTTLATAGVSAGETIWAWLLKRQACRNLLSLPDRDDGPTAAPEDRPGVRRIPGPYRRTWW